MFHTIENTTSFILNIVIDVLLLGFVFKISSISDLEATVKLITSIVVLVFVLIRVYFFVKGKVNKDDKSNSK